MLFLLKWTRKIPFYICYSRVSSFNVTSNRLKLDCSEVDYITLEIVSFDIHLNDLFFEFLFTKSLFESNRKICEI